MSYESLNLELHPERMWSELTLGAKVAVCASAITLIGASLVASVFLAAAALFSGLVMLIYGALSDQGCSAKKENQAGRAAA